MEDSSFDDVESDTDSNSTKPILLIAFLLIGILVGSGIIYFVFPQSSDQSISIDDKDTETTNRVVYLAQEEIKELKNIVQALQNDVNSKVNNVAEKNEEISELNEQISSLSSDIDVLENKLLDSDTKIRSLEIDLENSKTLSDVEVDVDVSVDDSQNDVVDMGDDVVDMGDDVVDMGDDVVDMGDDDVDMGDDDVEVNYLIEIETVDFVDSFGNLLSVYGAGDIIVIESKITNIHTEKVKFALKVLIREYVTNNVVYSQGLVNLELESGTSTYPGISWIPESTGTYIVEVYAVDDHLNLNPISATKSKNIEIT